MVWSGLRAVWSPYTLGQRLGLVTGSAIVGGAVLQVRADIRDKGGDARKEAHQNRMYKLLVECEKGRVEREEVRDKCKKEGDARKEAHQDRMYKLWAEDVQIKRERLEFDKENLRKNSPTPPNRQ